MNHPGRYRRRSSFHAMLVFIAAALLMPVTTLAGAAALQTDPIDPRENQAFDILYDSFCGADFPLYTVQNRTVEVVGSMIRIEVPFSNEFCAGQPAPAYRWRIGPFPPGKYQLELLGLADPENPDNLFPLASGDVVIAPFTPAPAPSVVPATGTLGLSSLALLLALVALVTSRRRLG